MRAKIWKTVILLGICLILMTVFLDRTTFQVEDGGKTTIVFLHSCGTASEEDQAIRTIYKDFEKNYPEIELNMISLPSEESVEEKIREMLLVGKLPDLMYIRSDGMSSLYPFMTADGYLEDLIPYLKEDEAFREMISAEALSGFLVNSESLYCISDTMNQYGIWYNRDMLENAGISELPKTWQELIEFCEDIKNWAEGINYDIASLNMNADTRKLFTEAYMAPYQADMAAGRREWNQVLNEAQEVIRQIEEQSTVRSQEFTQEENIRDFNIGRCAVYVGAADEGRLLNSSFQIEFSLFPSREGKSIGLFSLNQGYMISQNIGEEEKDACILFLKYMLSEEVQKRLVVETGNLPMNPAVDAKWYAKDNLRLQDACRKIEEGEIVQRYPMYEKTLD